MTKIAEYLAEHRFQDLFVDELGWDRAAGRIEFSVDGREWDLQQVAQKRGIQILHGQTDRLTLRNRARLRRLQQVLAERIHEHIVIYSCDGPRKQVWQWAVRREDGRRLRHREHPFASHLPPPRLLQRLEDLRFTLDQEDQVTLIDALRRVRQALDHDAEFNFFAKHPWYEEQSDRLAQAMETGGEAAVHAFVLFHRPLLTWIARRMAYLFNGDVEDAEQSGFVGLLHAARRYKRNRGAAFSTYAVRCIEGLCKRDGAMWCHPIRVPMHVVWPCLTLRRTLEQADAQGGQAAIDGYLAELALRDPGLAEQWPRFLQATSIKSLSQPREPEYRKARQITAPTVPPPAGMEHSERLKVVRDTVAKLQPRDAAFVRSRYGFEGEEQTLAQIGQEFGVTRERVRQRLQRVLPQLERRLRPVLELDDATCVVEANGVVQATDALEVGAAFMPQGLAAGAACRFLRELCMSANAGALEGPGQDPDPLRQRLAGTRFKHVAALGNRGVLKGRLLGFLCSSRCPGNLILDVYDVAKELREAPVTVVSGFHSPMERECLELLIRGSQPIIVCAARSLQRMRIPRAWKDALDSGRMLLLSPFPPSQRTSTAASALRRNRFIAQLADEVLVVHAASGGKAEAFSRDVLARRKPLLTIDRPENRRLLELGAQALSISDVHLRWPHLSRPVNEREESI